MSRLLPLWRLASRWYVSTIILGALGIVLGSLVFFNVWPGKPKIGFINIPFTVITERSAFEISALLEYARTEDSIDAVVITITSPGGGAAASEELFFETAKLREEKPVVVVMNDLVASGGYMLALGANWIYAKPSSFIGGIGVILSPIPPLIPSPPTERDVLTGPFKAEGGDRRHYVSLTDQLKHAFAQMVQTQRGDHLTMPLAEVTQGQIYSGIQGVRLGLVDGIGGRSDALEKAASLAGVSNYDIEDINTEVSRLMNQKRDRVRGSLELNGPLASSELLKLLIEGDPDAARILREDLDADVLRTLPLPGGIGEDPNSALPDFPLKINGPNAYYLYVGPSP
ncbi:MAG: hypothetical protein BZY81_07195 [SAR202 cluster bacterium Io17-Chloro-G4]|nr:MAG: hypothetical protein BZY81_07195 [SAR202 cluster bacterium Io17-Chloro-G4]